MNLGGTVPVYQTALYLRTLPAIRERCGRVHDLAKQGKLQYFDYHPEKEVDVAKFCMTLMKVCVWKISRKLVQHYCSATLEMTSPA